MALGCNLIVAHHPLIFHKLARITDDNYVQRSVMKAIENKITVVAMHTNMDNALGGVNFKIADKMGLTNAHFFNQKTVQGIECGNGVVGDLRNLKLLMISSLCLNVHSMWNA